MTAIRVLVKKLEKFVQPLVSNERWVALGFFSIFLLQALILATVGLALWIVPSQTLPIQLAEHQSPSPPPLDSSPSLDSAPLLDSAKPAGKAQPVAVPPPTDAMPIHASDTAAQKAFETDLDVPEKPGTQRTAVETQVRNESTEPTARANIERPIIERPKIDPQDSLAQTSEPISQSPASQTQPTQTKRSAALPQKDVEDKPSFDRLKNATAFVNTGNNSIPQVVGLLVMKKGATGYIVVPNRILSLQKQFSCLFRVGPSAIRCDINISKSRVSGNVMLLHVTHENLPEPVDLSEVAELRKSLPVTVLSYKKDLPHLRPGEEELQKVQCEILRLEQDATGITERMQLNNLLDHRDSGGPVVNTDGKFVGLAVPRIDNFGKEPFIDWIIPHNKIAELMDGSIGEAKCNVNPDNIFVMATLIDPYNKITSCMVKFYKKESLRNDLSAVEKTTQAAGESMQELELTLEDSVVGKRAHCTIKMTVGSEEWYYQLRVDLTDGTQRYYPVTKIENRPAETNVNQFAWSGPAEVSTQRPSEPFLLSSFPEGTISQFAYFNINAGKLLPTMTLSSDGSKLIVADKQGILYAFSTEDRSELFRFDLTRPCTSLGTSKLGIVAACENQITVLDENDFSIKRKRSVLGVKELACHPSNPMAYFYRKDDSKWVAVHLQTGDILPSPETVLDRLEAMSLSPDGRYLLACNQRQVIRFRISGINLYLEQTADLDQERHDFQPFAISHDSKFVALGLKANGNPGAKVNFGADKRAAICPIGGLETPEFMLDGASSTCIAFDPANDKIYSCSQGKLVIFLNRKSGPSYTLPDDGLFATTAKEEAVSILAHPKGNHVFLLTNFRLISAILSEPIKIKAPGNTQDSPTVADTSLVRSNPTNPIPPAPPADLNQRHSFRTWKDKTGQFQLNAKLVDVSNAIVLLEEPIGSQSDIELTQLSEADQEFLSKF